MKNALVALGGGPSPVINASLSGVLERCLSYPARIGKIYAAWQGIEGVLKEQLLDLGGQPKKELALLKNTPSSGAVGTCRYKLGSGADEDYARIVRVLEAHRIGWFFYIGGNDSMDTADKVQKLARDRGLDTVVVGVPKTIDNDLGDGAFSLIDHTPGYASAARYWANIVRDVLEENRGMCSSEPVTVLQAMGRSAGFITAAARLADPGREHPLQIYFPESGLGADELVEHVARELTRSGRCVVVVSEGFNAGDASQARDGFGHIEYGAGQTTAAQLVVNRLNRAGILARGNATGQVPGVLQRSNFIYRSVVDVEEAYGVGAYAAELAMRGCGGCMATILRKKQERYEAYYDSVALSDVAMSERFLPREWIAPGGTDVTDAFIRYAAPLLGDRWPDAPLENGLARFARLSITFIDRKCPDYVPQGLRAQSGTSA